MATLFVRHKVGNYTEWRKGYDAFDATRKSMGVSSHGVYQNDADPNDITVYHEFDSTDAAKSFIASKELADAMKAASVVGTPDIWITQRI
jgi:hypothetical protein